MIITTKQLKRLIRESLKDFFDAQDSGDWHKYDNAVGRYGRRPAYEQYWNYGVYDNYSARYVGEFYRVHLDDMALYQRDLKERYKDFTKNGIAAYRYIQKTTNDVDGAWAAVGDAIETHIRDKGADGASAAEVKRFEELWQKMKQLVPRLA